MVEQWNRVHLALTSKLLEHTYGPEFPRLKICKKKHDYTCRKIKKATGLENFFFVSGEEDVNLIPQDASHDCIAQCWFRFLHCLGNPVNLSRPTVISQTPKFLQFAIASENVVDPCQHPCLTALPQIFFKAIKGIAGQVDAFLGNIYTVFHLIAKRKHVHPRLSSFCLTITSAL